MSLVKHQHIIQALNDKLFEIGYIIKCFNKLGDYDINRYAENYFMRILNIIYKDDNWSLTKAIRINQDTYDLLDLENRICVQITSDNTKRKKRRTIEMFDKNEHSKAFNKLVIVFLSNRKPKSDGIEITMDYDDLNLIDLAQLIETKCKQKQLLELQDLLNPRNPFTHTGPKSDVKKDKRKTEIEFSRAIELEKELNEELVINNYYQKYRDIIVSKPYKKFKDPRFILRSYEDNTYPDVKDDSKWCRTFMYDFYDKGILIWGDTLFETTARINKKSGNWYIETYPESKEPLVEGEKRYCIRTIGRLPYTNILHWKDGDGRYNDYHLCCKYYGINGTPFEGIEYRYGVDKDDWFVDELDQNKMIEKANA